MISIKRMVLTLPARGNFRIIARHKSFVATQASFCRTGRGWAAHARRVRGMKFYHLQRESRCCPHSPFRDRGWGRVHPVTDGLNVPRHGIETALKP
jgi:hypothetical protein